MDDDKALFLRAAILYYAKCLKLKTRVGDTAPIGFPLQAYFPRLSAAIEAGNFGTTSQSQRRKETLKNLLCKRHGIFLVRITGPWEKAFEDGSCRCVQMRDDTEAAMEDAVSSAFELIGQDADVDFIRDRNAINETRKKYLIDKQ